MPTNAAAKDAEGKVTGCVYQGLLAEAEDWHKVWTDDCLASELEDAIKLIDAALQSCPEDLSPLTADDVHEASGAFRDRTSSPDGWHPKTFKLLSTAAKHSLAQFLNVLEKTGLWPESNSSLHLKLTPKPQGGNRLIGWYRALFRLWCKARKDLWVEWEDTHGSDRVFAASRGNSVIDVGWRQAARAELAVAEGNHVAIVVQDLRKCYEFIHFGILAAKPIRHTFL